MKFTKLHILEKKRNISLAEFPFDGVLMPSLYKGEAIQTHYIISASDSAVSLRIDLSGAAESCKLDFENIRSSWSITPEAFPYAMTESQWWQYCVAPHSYLSLGNNDYQAGLNVFNRFLHFNSEELTAKLVDPEIGDQFLSTTNWFDQENGEIWFASWPIEATVRRILNPQDDALVTIWKLSLQTQHTERIWQGNLADGLHQISVSADRRFIILTELGLRYNNPADSQSSSQASSAETRLIPSKILILDRKTDKDWHLSLTTAGHIEFDPQDADICYISGHNIGLAGIKVGIFGQGVIQKLRLQESGPELLGEFSHEHFYRITTHIVFHHRERTLIAASGYPAALFLIDAATMKLFKIISWAATDKVNTVSVPHICQQDSYGIGSSKDGEYIIIAGTGFIMVADIDQGMIVKTQNMDHDDANCCFTGHLGKFSCPEG